MPAVLHRHTAMAIEMLALTVVHLFVIVDIVIVHNHG
jgi:hypothetical protein